MRICIAVHTLSPKCVQKKKDAWAGSYLRGFDPGYQCSPTGIVSYAESDLTSLSIQDKASMVAVGQYYKSLDVGWKAVFQVLHTKCSPKTLVDSYSDVRLSFPSLKPFPNIYFSYESTLQDHNNS